MTEGWKKDLISEERLRLPFLNLPAWPIPVLVLHVPRPFFSSTIQMICKPNHGAFFAPELARPLGCSAKKTSPDTHTVANFVCIQPPKRPGPNNLRQGNLQTWSFTLHHWQEHRSRDMGFTLSWCSDPRTAPHDQTS